MSRLQQTVQNGFIRIAALFSVVFRSISGFLANIFGGFGKSLGFSNSNSGYYVDADTKKEIEESKTPIAIKTPEPVISGDRRRPKKSNMDDFMKMAKEIKKG